MAELNEIVLTVKNCHIPSSGTPPALETSPEGYIGYFENSEAEQLVFRYDYPTRKGMLWHGDYNWGKPLEVIDGRCPEIILSRNEQEWLQLVWQVAIK